MVPSVAAYRPDCHPDENTPPDNLTYPSRPRIFWHCRTALSWIGTTPASAHHGAEVWPCPCARSPSSLGSERKALRWRIYTRRSTPAAGSERHSPSKITAGDRPWPGSGAGSLDLRASPGRLTGRPCATEPGVLIVSCLEPAPCDDQQGFERIWTWVQYGFDCRRQRL